MLTLLLTLLACAPPTCDEVEGAICEDELAELLADDTGAAEGWAWFDAEGRQVTIDAELLWEDDDGVIWQVDPVGATVYPLYTDSPAEVPWYASDDCSGQAYGVMVPARKWAYVGSYDGPVLVWHGGAVEDLALSSRVYNGECDRFGRAPDVVVHWEDIEEVPETPAPSWSAPLALGLR